MNKRTLQSWTVANTSWRACLNDDQWQTELGESRRPGDTSGQGVPVTPEQIAKVERLIARNEGLTLWS